MAPSRVMLRDRTYASAVALRDWLKEHHVEPNGIMIVTESVHARRSRLLFSLALGRETRVGVLAVPSPDYDPRRWWDSSEAVKDVLEEAASYVYTTFIFQVFAK